MAYWATRNERKLEEFPAELGTTRSTFGRRLKANKPDYEQREFIAAVAETAGMPRGFFAGDLRRLDIENAVTSEILAELAELRRVVGGLDAQRKAIVDLVEGATGAAPGPEDVERPHQEEDDPPSQAGGSEPPAR